jgi:protein-tyrosine phosphatase
MATNDYLDLRRYTNIASGMEDAQEALTVILSARETFLDLALGKIKKDYGSLNQYLDQEMQLNDKQRGKLKDILLF